MFRSMIPRLVLPVAFALLCAPATAPAQGKPTPTPAAATSPLAIDAERFALAAEYSKSTKGLSVLVMKDGKVLHEAYHNGHSATKVAELASGTKSFNGVMALAAVEDGILTLDEKVSDTITEWKSDPAKASITVRELLTLSSGVGGGPIGRPPTYSAAVKMPIKAGAAGKFQYGPVPFQVFGELMKRKLADKGEGPLEYMDRRIFKPIGLQYGSWKRDKEGNPHLPSGARMTARDWAKFGELVRTNGAWNGTQIIDASLFPTLVAGTQANGNYGLTFWLKNLNPEDTLITTGNRRRGRGQATIPGVVPPDFFMAAGMGQQRLYIIPSEGLVIVRQGKLLSKTFRDDVFLKMLFTGTDPRVPEPKGTSKTEKSSKTMKEAK